MSTGIDIEDFATALFLDLNKRDGLDGIAAEDYERWAHWQMKRCIQVAKGAAAALAEIEEGAK